VRWRILKRDEYRCVLCGRSPATHAGLSLQIDHVIPVSRGGGDEEANLRTLCGECNNGRKDGE
jgi:5-methylcytosine-specific restriction endonuclease McrA